VPVNAVTEASSLAILATRAHPITFALTETQALTLGAARRNRGLSLTEAETSATCALRGRGG
jgi:hypothetical protein